MYTELKRYEKNQLARKFYYYLNYQYSSGGPGMTQKKWKKILKDENDDLDITHCLMWDKCYTSIFAILFKTYGVFRVVDESVTPHLYDIVNNLEHLIEEFQPEQLEIKY